MNKLIPTIVALALLLLSCATGDEKVSADASAPDTLSDLTSASDVSPDQEPVDTAQLELPEEFVEVYPMLPGHIDLLLQITSALRISLNSSTVIINISR